MKSEQKIFGRWSDEQGMLSDFEEYQYSLNKDGEGQRVKAELEAPVPTPDELLFASYGGGAYDGDAVVIFEKDGYLYEVHGSHCSCYGLEGSWSPSKISWEALNLRVQAMDDQYGFLHDHESEAREAFKAMVMAHVVGGSKS